jgi:hypothetical protein
MSASGIPGPDGGIRSTSTSFVVPSANVATSGCPRSARTRLLPAPFPLSSRRTFASSEDISNSNVTNSA